MEYCSRNEKFRDIFLERDLDVPKSKKRIATSRRPQLTRASRNRAVRIVAAAATSMQHFGCREQRAAIKCGRGEISRGIDYWSSFESGRGV